MKLAAICCTYLRPRELENVIESFLRQDHPADQRELVVLDDAGQYSSSMVSGLAGVKLITCPVRFRTLGEKRNASAALVSPSVDAYCVWDDDDVYLPWHMSAAAAALADADYAIPTSIYVEKHDHLESKPNQHLFHGGWSFRRRAFETVHGYPFMQSGQDQGLLRRFKSSRLRRADPLQSDARPSYVYRWFTTTCRWHISAMGSGGYERLAHRAVHVVDRLEPRWHRDWLRLHEEAYAGHSKASRSNH